MLTLVPILLLANHVIDRPLFHPSTEQVAATYKVADGLGRKNAALATMMRLTPEWLDGGKAFWYRKDALDGKASYVKVDCATGTKTPLFDAKRLADSLSKAIGTTVDPEKLPFQTVRFLNGKMRFDAGDSGWELDETTYELKKVDPAGGRNGRRRQPRPNMEEQSFWPPSREPQASPDGAYKARIVGQNIMLSTGGAAESTLTTDGNDKAYYAQLRWSADSKRIVAVRVHPGDRKKVYLIQNTPATWGPAELKTRVYDRPGDVVDTFDIVTFDPATKQVFSGALGLDYGDLPSLRPTKDKTHFTYERMDRGYGRWRVLSLDPLTDQTTELIDDHPATFVDSTAQYTQFLDNTDEIVFTSERDGWHHLYLADGKGGITQITKGQWVVRGVTKVDEAKRQILFSASGMSNAEDPYFIHYYRINFDGSGLTPLTPEPGNHTAALSPDGSTLLDDCSSTQVPPVYKLRRADTGAMVSVVDRGDVSALLKTGWRPPTPFVAMGRDGKTPIYGIYYKPSTFDDRTRYPVVEDIYAGPQDSFVPKNFQANNYDQSVAELGFIVVKIDGMGTRNRSKAFHDVCYKNLADAGFPDRILWMKALAKEEPSIDLDRVGIFGTSAGGQNAGGAVLFHPEFYKVAIASCGCHDNRLDKVWWNEQWMGVMGPHYAASSNIENASKLQGNLLLMVGELDTNVPPESTFRYAAALQAAGKEFELVVIPNSDHTAGGPYGERKRRDFLVRHLLGVEPPNPNRKL